MSLKLRGAVVTDPGLIRSNNEDSAYAGEHLIIVADGMGGLPAGELASDIVLRGLRGLDDPEFISEPLAALRDALAEANDEVKETAAADPDRHGMGTTATAMLLRGTDLALVHVGDSRAYLLRDGLMEQITTDDTYVQMLVDHGEIAAEDARFHPQRSLVTQAVQGGAYEPHCSVLEPRVGDRFLLCSDGLTDIITDETVHGVLTSGSEPLECAERLVKLTLAAGAPDNVTVLVADIVDVD